MKTNNSCPVDKCQKSIYSHSCPESHACPCILICLSVIAGGQVSSANATQALAKCCRGRVSFNFVFLARAGSKAEFFFVGCLPQGKIKFPEVSEIAEIPGKMTAPTLPPTHPLIRHNAVLFLVTIKGPPGASRKLFIFCYITSLCLRRLLCAQCFRGDASRLSPPAVGSLPSHSTSQVLSQSSALLERGAAHESAAGPCFEKQIYRGKGKRWTPH